MLANIIKLFDFHIVDSERTHAHIEDYSWSASFAEKSIHRHQHGLLYISVIGIYSS